MTYACVLSWLDIGNILRYQENGFEHPSIDSGTYMA